MQNFWNTSVILFNLQKVWFSKIMPTSPATLLKRDSIKVFSSKFCGISKNTFLHRRPLVAASFRSVDLCHERVNFIVPLNDLLFLNWAARTNKDPFCQNERKLYNQTSNVLECCYISWVMIIHSWGQASKRIGNRPSVLLWRDF